MIFHKSEVNPMHDIISLFPKEWTELNQEIIDKFELLLVSAGFVPETEIEVEKSFFALEELGIFDISYENEKVYIKRKINYGE